MLRRRDRPRLKAGVTERVCCGDIALPCSTCISLLHHLLQSREALLVIAPDPFVEHQAGIACDRIVAEVAIEAPGDARAAIGELELERGLRQLAAEIEARADEIRRRRFD